MKKNFLITTGGSGGHVIPAIIFYEHLLEKANITITSDKRGLKYLDEKISDVEVIDTPKLDNIFFLPINLIVIFFLVLKSIILIKKKKIRKLVSTGGYMSLPLVLAARFLKIDIYLIEPNKVLGRANRFFLNSCKKIFCYLGEIKNFPESKKNKIVKINPLVRKKVYSLSSLTKKEIKTLLVVGGSQGAKIFDENLRNIILRISKKKKIKIIQQTSEKNVSNLKNFYSKNGIENLIFNFDKDLNKIMCSSDLCITRAGASTLSELSVLNIPFIAVPLPTSKDNHQLENANFYKNNNCCWLIEQKYFEEKIEKILYDIFDHRINLLEKKEILKKLNYQNTWINVNQKILKNINEN